MPNTTLMTANECDECVALFLQGSTAKELGAKYSRHPRTIEKLLARRGVSRRKQRLSRSEGAAAVAAPE